MGLRFVSIGTGGYGGYELNFKLGGPWCRWPWILHVLVRTDCGVSNVIWVLPK